MLNDVPLQALLAASLPPVLMLPCTHEPQLLNARPLITAQAIKHSGGSPGADALWAIWARLGAHADAGPICEAGGGGHAARHHLLGPVGGAAAVPAAAARVHHPRPGDHVAIGRQFCCLSRLGPGAAWLQQYLQLRLGCTTLDQVKAALGGYQMLPQQAWSRGSMAAAVPAAAPGVHSPRPGDSCIGWVPDAATAGLVQGPGMAHHTTHISPAQVAAQPQMTWTAQL